MNKKTVKPLSLRTACAAISLLILVAIPFIATAQNNDIIAPLNTGNTESPVDSTGQLYNILITVVKWVYTVFFILAVLFILFAAYGFVTSKGDEDKVKNAKNQLKYAVIAIAIALVSSGASLLIKNFLENPSGSGNNNSTPQQDLDGSRHDNQV